MGHTDLYNASSEVLLSIFFALNCVPVLYRPGNQMKL